MLENNTIISQKNNIEGYKIQSLFVDNEQKLEIKKHSSIIQVKSKTNLSQKKLINGLFYVSKKYLEQNQNMNRFSIDLGYLKKICGIENTNTTYLKKIITDLMNIKFDYNLLGKDKKKWGIFQFLSEIYITEDNKKGEECIIEFEFPTTILNSIKYPDIYTTLNLYIIKGINSKYGIVFYEIFKDYINLGKVRVELDKLKELLGIEDKKYRSINTFKKKVIEKGVSEVNDKTDIFISYKFIKSSRKFEGIEFFINYKKTIQELDEKNKDFIDKLKKIGLKQDKINELLLKHKIDYILENLKICEIEFKKGKIKNFTGYFLKSLEKDFRTIDNEYTNLEKLKKIEKEKEKKRVEDEEKAIKERKDKELEIRNERFENYWKGLSNEDKDKFEKEFYNEKILKNEFIKKYWNDKEKFENKFIYGTFKSYILERISKD